VACAGKSHFCLPVDAHPETPAKITYPTGARRPEMPSGHPQTLFRGQRVAVLHAPEVFVAGRGAGPFQAVDLAIGCQSLIFHEKEYHSQEDCKPKNLNPSLRRESHPVSTKLSQVRRLELIWNML